MFGSLYYTLKESWYKNTNNQIITFNTINRKMKWQIFSIYVSDPDGDYLYYSFASKDTFQEWINKINK